MTIHKLFTNIHEFTPDNLHEVLSPLEAFPNIPNVLEGEPEPPEEGEPE
jgi:hypothetical protein